jgi:anti-sigma factor RsiW
VSALERSVVCERVRVQVSLLLDGELSQFERRMLDAHLAQCPDCVAYADDVTSFTDQIRYAPMLPLERPVVVQRRSRFSVSRVQMGVAAVVGLIAVGLGSQLAESEAKGDLWQAPPVTKYTTRAQLDYEQALLRSLEVRTNVSLGSVVL